MIARAWSSQVLLAGTLLLAGSASAQDSYLTRWREVQSLQPQTLQCTIEMPKTIFFLGEVIPLKLLISSTEPKTFMISPFPGLDEFVIDPAGTVEDLQKQPRTFVYTGPGPSTLSDQPESFEKVLNESVRFKEPGTYRVYATSKRVQPAVPDAGGRAVEIVSNIITLELRPAPENWVQQQIAAAVSTLEAPLTPSSWQARRDAHEVLRFVGTPDAMLALAKHMDDQVDARGILDSPYRKQLLPLLEKRLTAPDQPVTSTYLETLAQLAEMSSRPEESKTRWDVVEQKRNEYATRLFTTVLTKQSDARAISMYTLLNDGVRGGVVTWLIANFHTLPSNMQSNLLYGSLNGLNVPAMVPLLREIYRDPPQPGMSDIAIRRLYELRPDEARDLVIAEIRHPEKQLRFDTMAILRDETLPEVNQALAAQLEAGARQYSVDQLIARYATGDIVQRVEAVYRGRSQEYPSPNCASPLVFYLLKYDPPFGERELRRNLATTPLAAPLCYNLDFQIRDLGRHAMSPAFERLAIEYLSSPAVPIKKNVAEILGKYGSAAAQEPLWHALEDLYSWWQSHEEEIQKLPHWEGFDYERTLRTALANADSWVLDEAGINRLLALCITRTCTQQTSQWLRGMTSPIGINIGINGDRFSANIGRYESIPDDQLKRKLSQFPPGTMFRLGSIPNQDALASRRARQIVQEAIESTGHKIVP